MTPLVSIIIVNWNGCEMLDACLASVYTQEFPAYEVVVVDNGSVDQSIPMVQAKYPQARLLALEKNTGFCYANNHGVREALGEFVVLLNNDTEVESTWLRPLYDFIVQYPDVAACDSKVLYDEHRDVIWSAGALYSPAGTAHPRAYGEYDDERFSAVTEVFGAVACSAIYRREVFERLGGLDEDFFAGYEDVDWSFRARAAGYRIFNVPASRVYHKVSMTQVHNSAPFVYRGQRNVEIVYLKNMPITLLLRYGLAHIFYVLGSGVYFICIGRGAAFWNGKIDAYKAISRTLEKRRQLSRGRRTSVRDLLFVMDRGWLRRKALKLRKTWIDGRNRG
jgi:GT2 family glycosyltransferase